MKRIFTLIIFIFLFRIVGFSQVLNVKKMTQEHDQWCWAGVSSCILDFYGTPTEQCEIAEYARQKITWYDFGSVNCCKDASQGCNYWNYNYGYEGSIKYILEHFAGISNYGYSNYLTKEEVIQNLSGNKPFVIRWGWTAGGGHFVVGHGISDNTVYYMDPWFGEGLKFGTYEWVKNDGNHEWTHTNVLTTSANAGIENNISEQSPIIYPNPAKDFIKIENIKNTKIEIVNIQGQNIINKTINSNNTKINIKNLKSGIYFLKIFDKNKTSTHKFIVQ